MFAVGTDADISVINVQNRVQSALQLLPEEVRRQGVTVAKSLPSFLMILSFDSPDGRYDELFVSNYATLNVIDELRRIPGVGNVQVFGARDYSIRIWLKPDRLAELGLTPADVAAAVREQNAQSAAGRLGDEPIDERVDLTLSVTTQARLSDPAEFERRGASATTAIVRLKDVARVELGARDYSFGLDHKAPVQAPATARADANALQTAAAVYAKMDELGAVPGRPRVVHSYDTSSTSAPRCARSRSRSSSARARVRRVWLFLYNLRATVDSVGRRPVSLVARSRAGARFLDQHADAVRHGARDRHRRRRRDRRARERRADHARGRRVAARGGNQGDARGDRSSSPWLMRCRADRFPGGVTASCLASCGDDLTAVVISGLVAPSCQAPRLVLRIADRKASRVQRCLPASPITTAAAGHPSGPCHLVP
jgi:hypothetical protein